MISWNEYLIICTLGIVIGASIIGWRKVLQIYNYPLAFFLVMYMTYVVRPYVSYTVGSGLYVFDLLLPGISYMVAKDKLDLALVFCPAVISFGIGYRLIHNRYSYSARVEVASQNNPNQVNAIYLWASIGFVILGYSSFLIARRGFLGFGGGPIELIATKSGTTLGNTTGYVELANYLIITGVLLYYASTRKLNWSILLAAPWIANQVYYGWARFMLIVLGFGLMGVWLVHRRNYRIPVKHGIFVMPVAIASIILLILMRSDREFARKGKSIDSLVEGVQSTTIDNALGDFSGFEGTWFMISTMNYRTPLYGSSIIYNLFIKPIPRIIWKGKILLRDFTWSDILNNDSYESYLYTTLGKSEDLWYQGPVRGSIGYALEEWGWVGLAINFIITGLFLGWIQTRVLVADQDNPAWIAAYAATYGLIGLLGRNDLFSVLTYHVLLFYIPYALINYLAKRYPLGYPSRRQPPVTGISLHQKPQ